MVQRAYKYRIYPTEEQKKIINQTMGCCRWLWNYALDKIEKENEKYKEKYKNKHKDKKDKKRERPSVSQIIDSVSKEIPKLKEDPETAFLKEAIASSLIWSLRNLNTAWSNYFRDLKAGRIEKKRNLYISKRKQRGLEVSNKKLYEIGRPKFKKRFHAETCQFHQGYSIDFEKSVINMPKCLGVKAVFHRKFSGLHKTTTVERTASGKYYISILVQDMSIVIPKTKKIKEKTTVGLHNGIKNFVTSDEAIVIAKTNRFLRDSLERLAVLQRRLSKKVKKSNRWNRQRIQVAKLHEKITNQRDALLHHVSCAIINNPKYQTICIENWDKIEMMGDPIFAQAIADVSWGSLIEYIKYKAEWNGKNILELDAHAPNAKTCSNCEHINEWVELKHRIWTCENCGTEHKREINCAINTKQMGLKAFFDNELV